MTKAIKLEHVALPTTEENWAETVNFYKDLFGWTTIREIGSGPTAIAFIGDGEGGVFEVYVAEGEPMTAPAHVAFAVPVAEYDALRNRLLEAGVVFTADRENAVGDKLGFFLDPAGNCAQIVGRIEPLG